MKSEQRHELQTNILADRIGTGIESARPVLPMVLGAIALVVVGLLGWGLYSSNARSRTALAWTDYYFNLTTSTEPGTFFDLQAGDADDFLDVADEFPSSSVAKWAQLSAGGQFLEQGVETLYRNRVEGEKLLNQAVEAFGVAAEASEPSLSLQAHYGLGRSYEALSKLSEAAEAYEQVLAEEPYEALKKDVERRLEFISSQEGKEFYAWFSKLDPKPDAPIRLPSDLSTPPTNPGEMSFDPLPTDLLAPPTSAAEDAASVEPATAEPTPAEIDPASIPAPTSDAGTTPASTTEASTTEASTTEASTTEAGVIELTPPAGTPAGDTPAAPEPATQPN